MSLVDIIVPTFNNNQYLIPCVQSLFWNTLPNELFHLIVVNNGDPHNMEALKNHPNVTILQMNQNAGWEGGLKAGLAISQAEYVMFLNDDTMIPSHQRLWLSKLLNHFEHKSCAAVGPTSNVVMGKQNIFFPYHLESLRTKFLIGFCLLVRRSDLDAVGGIDDTLPGGDDLDLSIRLRNLGKYLLIDRDVFVWHHGFKTGERVEGPASQANGWNSIEKMERTNFALIRKHGLRAFLDLFNQEETPDSRMMNGWGDLEGNIVRKYSVGEKIAELGCGDKKTLPNSIGIDIMPRGEQIPGVSGSCISIADITADVQHELPVRDCDTIMARHILEHMVDATAAVTAWRNALKHGGRLIVAVPDHTTRNTIVMNYQHVHAWTPDSLKNFMETLGLKTVAIEDAKNEVSFVGVFERNGN
jgi:GT2 family glycosyltransferase/predicted SAM-dependent methyltransferase